VKVVLGRPFKGIATVKTFIGIGVENYLEATKISSVKYAEADVREFAKVLEQHGFAADDRHLLINAEATQTRIRSVIRTTLDSLGEGDTVYIYFAGHGVGISGINYVSCYDSRISDLPGTCIDISWLFERCKASSCKKIVLFLDSCRSGMIGPEGIRDIYTEFDVAELRKFLAKSEHCVCFAACKTDQSSWPSAEFGHGVWTYHLIEAFDGQAEMALKGFLLTDTSLQNYLQHIVPISLRDVNPSAIQTPWRYGGNSSDFLLADLENVLESRRIAKHPKDGQIKDSILVHEEREHITRLTNFNKRKGHFVPQDIGGEVDSFIGKMVADEVEGELKGIRDKLKDEFGYTRKECKISSEGGSGTVTTPHFNYNLSVGQDHIDYEDVCWRREIDSIIEPNTIFSKEFANVFSDTFNTIELSLHGKTDLDNLVDFIEGLRRTNKDIGVEYDEDKNISSCVIRMKGHAPIHVTRSTFSIVHSTPASPRDLVDSLFKAQIELTQKYKVLAIPFEVATAPKLAAPLGDLE